MALSEEELRRYRSDGYIVPRFQLSRHRLGRLQSALERVMAANPDTRPEHLVSAHISGRNREGISGDAEFLDLARDPGVLDMVEQLIGPDVILWGCQVFCKPGGDGMEVPWHQDGQYWPIRPLATCTAWVALDDSDVGNGCMRVIPGSHAERKLYRHVRDQRPGLTLNQRVASEDLGVSSAADVELRAGELSFHDVHLIHGSNPNRSDRRRAGVAIRYMPGTSHFDRSLFEPGAQSGYLVDFRSRPLWLLRGRDLTGKNDFSAGHG